jgi:hypothetical protein
LRRLTHLGDLGVAGAAVVPGTLHDREGEFGHGRGRPGEEDQERNDLLTGGGDGGNDAPLAVTAESDLVRVDRFPPPQKRQGREGAVGAILQWHVGAGARADEQRGDPPGRQVGGE